MSDSQSMPDFPNVAGARFITESDRNRISEAAWKQSNGSVRAYEQLCAEHARGEIDLFSDNPTAIRIRGASPAPGSDRFTATGGETAGEAGRAAAPQTALSTMQTAAASDPATTGTAASAGTMSSAAPDATFAGTVALGDTIASAGSVTNAGTAGG